MSSTEVSIILNDRWEEETRENNLMFFNVRDVCSGRFHSMSTLLRPYRTKDTAESVQFYRE